MTQNEIKYILKGDYYVPDLSMKTYHRLGKWGQIYKRYLKESRPIQYQVLLVNDKLWVGTKASANMPVKPVYSLVSFRTSWPPSSKLQVQTIRLLSRAKKSPLVKA